MNTLRFAKKEYLKNLCRDYQNKLIDNNLSIPRKDLRKKDLIDLRNILTYNNEPYDKQKTIAHIEPDNQLINISTDFILENLWYSCIPCFNEGVIQINTARYIHYNILKLDTIENKMDIQIKEYLRESDIWQFGRQTTIHYDFHKFTKKDEIQRAIDYITEIKEENKDTKDTKERIIAYIIELLLWDTTYTDSLDIIDVCKLLNVNELNWTKPQINMWNNFMTQWQEKYNKQQKELDFTPEDRFSKIFTVYVILSNQMLYEHKPKAIRNTNKSNQKRTIVTDNTQTQPKKLVRTIGPISMTSTKPPKLPTKETIVKYKTAVWKSRGGVRRLKNGKLVPFKESIKHRKCLQNTTESVPQSIVQFKQNTQKDEQTQKSQ